MTSTTGHSTKDGARAVAEVINTKEFTMNKDQIKGRTNQAAGKIKEVSGKITGNKKTEAEGAAEKAAGKVRANFGDLKRTMNK